MSPSPDLEQYTKLVHQLAWRYARRLPRRTILSEPDLAQEGWLTLTKALRSFVPGKAKFSTYATISLARRYAEILRTEHRRTEHDGPSLDAVGVEGTARAGTGDSRRGFTEGWRSARTPPQTLVDARVDLERGQWTGPALRTQRQAEEARERLAVLA